MVAVTAGLAGSSQGVYGRPISSVHGQYMQKPGMKDRTGLKSKPRGSLHWSCQSNVQPAMQTGPVACCAVDVAMFLLCSRAHPRASFIALFPSWVASGWAFRRHAASGLDCQTCVHVSPAPNPRPGFHLHNDTISASACDSTSLHRDENVLVWS